MNILYGKKFNKDIDAISHDSKTKKRLGELIVKLKEADSISQIQGVKKIAGYEDYYRIRLSDYRIGLRYHNNNVEMIRFLHRKEIYRRFP